MHNEQVLDYRKVTPEYIRNFIQDHRINELTCLVPKDDESASSVLTENGFRYCGKRQVEDQIMVVLKWFRGLDQRYEDMASFFNRRVSDYDLHMQDGNEYYEPEFISLVNEIPQGGHGTEVLDLGCGTGAELKYIFIKLPDAHVVCVDVAEEMLVKLRENNPEFMDKIEIQCVSYVGRDFGEDIYDSVIACSTLHHLLAEDKADLYMNIQKALKAGGTLLILDYVALSAAGERSSREKYLELIDSGIIDKKQIYHIDLPLTIEHEVELLQAAGFTISRLERWGENGIMISALHD